MLHSRAIFIRVDRTQSRGVAKNYQLVPWCLRIEGFIKHRDTEDTERTGQTFRHGLDGPDGFPYLLIRGLQIADGSQYVR